LTLDANVPLDVPVDDLAVHAPDYKNLIAFLKAMEFTSITRRVAEKSGIDAAQVEADSKLSSVPRPSAAAPMGRPRAAAAPRAGNLRRSRPAWRPEALTPISLSNRLQSKPLRATKLDATKYETIDTLDGLKRWIDRAYATPACWR